MIVYILDPLYRRIIAVDKFESLVWTERFSAFGDFELVLNSTLENRNRFKVGTRIAITESYRVMTVETVENTTNSEGKSVLKLSGPSLEEVLDDRIALADLTNLIEDPKWILTGTPTEIVRQIFHDICITGTLDPADVISSVVEDSIFPEDTIAEPSEEITVEIEPTSVYTAIKNICDIYEIGFRLVRDQDTSILYWDVYMGSDRTSSQTTLPAVVFSPGLDNLENTTELTTAAIYKNVAYVISPVGHEIVVPLNVDPEIEGFERHVLLVKADDITDVDPEVASAKMIQRGKEELSKNRQFSGFDGEVGTHIAYKYGTHYNLGDLVELRSVDGTTSQMQVIEQIFVSDAQGERSYPTLAINTFVTPGSWSAWDYNQKWIDMGLTEYWQDQP